MMLYYEESLNYIYSMLLFMQNFDMFSGTLQLLLSHA